MTETTSSWRLGGIDFIMKKPSLFVEDPKVVFEMYTLAFSIASKVESSMTYPEIELLYF